VWYADTATSRKESLTGADLGLIIHARLPGQDEFFKVARFQAKKVDRFGKARIDVDQTKALLQHEQLGYYLFYHSANEKGWSLTPTVQSAVSFKSDIEKTSKGKIPVSARNAGYDFAMFICLALADPASEAGIHTTDGRKAVIVLMSGPLPPSRVLIVMLGDGTSVLKWEDLLREYIGRGFD